MTGLNEEELEIVMKALRRDLFNTGDFICGEKYRLNDKQDNAAQEHAEIIKARLVGIEAEYLAIEKVINKLKQK